jgi:hypothetical protein
MRSATTRWTSQLKRAASIQLFMMLIKVISFAGWMSTTNESGGPLAHSDT